MRRVSVVSLLIFLLVVAMLDDVWVTPTLETGDEVLALQNNDYLHSPSQSTKKRPGEGYPPPLYWPSPLDPSLLTADRAPRPTEWTRLVTLHRPPLVYLLLSLQL